MDKVTFDKAHILTCEDSRRRFKITHLDGSIINRYFCIYDNTVKDAAGERYTDDEDSGKQIVKVQGPVEA